MPVQAGYLAYVLEQLSGLGAVSSRRMFGGVGLYQGELFFGLIDDDTLFFKTGESNAAEYLARNMPRFMPPASRPLGPMGYHEVPADIIEDSEALTAWARKAVAVALAAYHAKAAVKSRPQAKQKRKAKPKRKAKQPVTAKKKSRR